MSIFNKIKIKKTSSDKSSSLPFISSLAELTDFKKKRAILVGNSVFVSMRNVKMDGFANFKTRSATSLINGLFIKEPGKVFFSVNSELVRGAPKNIHFAIAADAYLDWGFKTKGSAILLGGVSSETETNLQVFFFEDGILVNLEERSIQGYLSPHYSETAATLIDKLLENSPGATVAYAAPLARFNDSLKDIEYVDDRIFRYLKYIDINVNEKVQSTNIKVPVGIALLGVLIYTLALGKGWSIYQNSISDYDESIKDPIVKLAGGVGGSLIDKIEQQRFFMLQSRNQIVLAEKTSSLVNAISKIREVRITDMSVQIPASPDTPIVQEKPDIKMVISVPKSEKSALDQGKEILEVISANTGLNLRMARQGWKDVEKRRVYILEGFFHG